MPRPAVALAARVLAACVLAACVLSAGAAGAQPFALGRPGVGLAEHASARDATAVETNASAMALLPSWSIVYRHLDAPGSPLGLRADGVFLAAPLPFRLGLGLGLRSERGPGGTWRRGRARLGLALAPTEAWSLGVTMGHEALSTRSRGRAELGLSTTFRPAAAVSLSLAAEDVFGPFDLTGGGQTPVAGVLSAALRPFGTRHVGLEATLRATSRGELDVGVAAGVTLPYVGRVLAVGELSGVEGASPDWTAGAAVELGWGGASVLGGALTGEQGELAWVAGAGLSGASVSGAAAPGYVLDLEVAGLDERSILELVVVLDELARDESAEGVLLRMRGSGLGMAYAQEVREMVDLLQARGKRVACHLESASGSELYACATADATWIDPGGVLRLVGPSSETLLFGETLRSLGVRAEFLRIGDYKSAPEAATNRRSSSAAVEQRQALLDDARARLIGELAADLGRTPDEVAGLVDGGPYLADESVLARLVGATADEQDMSAERDDVFGRDARLVDERPLDRAERWGARDAVGVVLVDGNIVDGESVDVPFLGVHMTGGRTIVEALDRLAADRSIGAIVLRVDSGGGAVLASEQIWRAVTRARKKKPVVASMGSVAASGGYYAAAAAQEIWADPTTVTGSIGIFYGKIDLAGLAERAGITVELVRGGRHAGMDSLFRPFDPEERALLGDKMRVLYRAFLRRIVEGRGGAVAEVDRVARGRVWSGAAAAERGLVDRLGGFGAALRRARELGGLPDDAAVRVVPRRRGGLLELVLGGASVRLEAPDVPLAEEVRRALELAITLARATPGLPLALAPELAPVTLP